MKHIYELFTIAIALLATSLAANAQGGTTYNNEGGVSTAKNVTGPDEDGYYTIKLETYATGTSALTETGIPVDIVLVLDVSGSMEDNLTTYTYTERSEQAYSYNGYGNNTYYYLHTDGEYYPVSRERPYELVGYSLDRRYRLYFTVGNTTYYLSGTGVTTTAPTNVTSQNTTIWTGVLYARSSSTQPKIDALKAAVNAFINEVYKNAYYDSKGKLRSTPIDNQISIVKYAADRYCNANGTSMGTPYDVEGQYANVITPGNHKGAKENSDYNYTEVTIGFTDLTSSNGLTDLRSAVTALSEGGATASDFGMTKAKYLLANLPSDRESNKVVVMFTDGEPNHSRGFDSTVASTTIDVAHTLKTTYEATIFTIGVFDSITSDLTEYMNFTSSNYPDAQAMGNGGTGSDKGYYQNASNADLTTIFKSIAGQAAAADASIGAQTQVRDVVANSFVLPEGASASDVTVASWDITEDGSGWENETILENGEDIDITMNEVADASNPDIKRKQIIVEGFDYSLDDTKNADGFTVTPGNWVGKRYFSQTDIRWKGKKLVITFKVRASGEATGGAGTNTNHPSSGVYVYNPETQQYTSVNSYPVPHTTLPLILKIQKDGLRHGESATFEIHRANPLMEVVKDAQGNVIKSKIDPTKDSLTVVYNAIGKPMPDMDTDGNWSKVILTNKGEDGAPVTKVLMALDPNFVYSIIEDDWGWSYELTGESSTLTTSDVEVNPFIFHNRLKEGTVKHAEAVSINHFATSASAEDSYTEDYQSSKVSSFTTPSTGGSSGSGSGSKGKK